MKFIHYYPKDFVKQILQEIKDIGNNHAYLAFILLCSGIELLGKCIDIEENDWAKNKRYGFYFKKGLELFPSHYKIIEDKLYTELRCGMTHNQLPGGYKLTEKRNDSNNELKYEEHLKNDSNLIVWEFIYSDFAKACNDVISMTFPEGGKMDKPFMSVGPYPE